MADKSALNKLYFEILLSKNKLPLLQTYYSNIKNEILTDLTNLHNSVLAAQSWVDSQITYLTNNRTEQATATNNFVASSSDNLIVSHPKYLEMMERYAEYVSNFYSRIHSLENIGVSNSYTVSNFIANEIGQMSSYWKFHYSENYNDALPIEHKYRALNITSESVVLEVSNSRYLYFTNENIVYDVDYITKDVYISYLDPKLLDGIYEESRFYTLFSVPDKDKIYAYVIQNKVTGIDAELIIGETGETYAVDCLEYDITNHKFKWPEGTSSRLYIKDSIINNDAYKLRVVDTEAVSDYYYVYIADYITRVKIDGNDEGYVSPLPQKTANVLCDVVKFGNYFVTNQVNDTHNGTRLVAISPLANGSLDIFNPSAAVTLNDFAENDVRFNSDSKIVNIFKATNVGGYGHEGVYVATNTNIWYIPEIVGNTIDVSLDERKRSIGVLDYSFADNVDLYTIDEFGYIYILKDHTYLYCAKTDGTGVKLFGNVVQAPTRYADKLVNLQNVISENRSGYAFNKTDNITMAQLGDVGNEEFIYSFVMKDSELDAGILYGITKSGKVAYCDIATGAWNGNSISGYCYSSFTGGREITAICQGEKENILYVALSNYNILKVTKSEITSGQDIDLSASNLVYNTAIGSRIRAMVYIDAFKVLYMATASGSVAAYDFNNDSYHTADVTSSDYNESDKSRYAITRGDDAIGNVSINCITTDGNNLIVMGANGRVSSCSLSDFMWTPYKTANENIQNYSSNIFYDGTYQKDDNTLGTCRDIVSFINYNNIKLIVFTQSGEIFSCNLSTGVWTDVTGKIVLHNGSGFGPGIYNDGSALGGKAPLAVTRIGTVLYMTGEAARLASVSIVDGAITKYNGSNASALVGPGYAYTGEDVAETVNINTVTTDNRGKLFMLGSTNVVLTYSIESNEVIIPTNSKLYYIARRQSRYDFMSSLLVRVSKGELNEKVPLYPPTEEEDSFTSYIQSSNYVFKNGNYVWKINTALDVIYFSDNGGLSYRSTSVMLGSELLPTGIQVGVLEYVSSAPKGTINAAGNLTAVFSIGSGRAGFLLSAKATEDSFDVRWFDLGQEFTQKRIEAAIVGDDEIYTWETNTPTVDYTHKYSAEAGWNTVNNVAEISNGFIIEKVEDRYDLKKDGKIIVSDIYGKVKEYANSVIGSVADFETSRPKMYVSNDNDINFVYGNSGDIYVVTIHFIDLSLGESENNVIITNAKVPLGITGVTGYDILYSPKANSAFVLVNAAKTATLVSLNATNFGEYNVPNYRVITTFDARAKMVTYDPDEQTVIVATYKTADANAVITHTNAVHSYTVLDSVVNTPIRALTNAWRTFQVTLGNGSDSSVPNAVSLRLKFNNSNETETDIVSKQFTLRYKVLISDITNGKFILYEVEKSVGMSKTDDDTRTIEPFFRVIAIDGFEDEIFELYTSKFDRYHKVSSTEDLSEYVVAGYSYDFMTFIQRFTGDANAVYQIKICCENTLPANVDACFYAESYYQDTTAKARYKNKIETSEYKIGMSTEEANTIFGKNVTGFIMSTKADKDIIKYPVTVNPDYVPQKHTDDTVVGIKADTYMCIVRGDGTGLFDKLNCVLEYNPVSGSDQEYTISPLSKNKKDLRFVFDHDGSSGIMSRFNGKIDTLRNGRTVHKMHNRAVFSKNVINNPDYYTDFKGRGRIVNVDGTLTNNFGLFESISTLDGNQKRIKQISESRVDDRWSNATTALDIIKKRDFGYGYDIIDRYSVFEAPYNMIKAWWVPAKSLITRGNERLHNFTFNDGKRSDVGLKYGPADNIDNPSAIASKSYTGGSNPNNNGINATINGQSIANPDTVEAYTELIDEKFPLENWDGWEWAKMCFIRKWRKVFTDHHIEYKYEVESPATVTVSANGSVTLTGSVTYTFNSVPYNQADFAPAAALLAAIKPSIDRQVYWYSDEHTELVTDSSYTPRNESEGISTETWKRATAYYYVSHNWCAIKNESLILNHANFFKNDDDDPIRELHNFAQLTEEQLEAFLNTQPNISAEWYVTSSTDSVNKDNLELLHHDAKYSLETGQTAPHKLDDDTDRDSVSFKLSPFPLSTAAAGNVIGERIISIDANIPDDVTKAEISGESINWTTGDTLDKSRIVKHFIRGLNVQVHTDTGDTTLFQHTPVLGYLDGSLNVIDPDDIYVAVETAASLSAFNAIKAEFLTAKSVKLAATVIDSYGPVVTPATASKEWAFADNAAKTNSITNYYGFNYGVGTTLFSKEGVLLADNGDITIAIKIASYKSVTSSTPAARSGMFVDFNVDTYTVSVAPDSNDLDQIDVAYQPAAQTKVSFSAGSAQPVLDSYVGKNSYNYLFKNKYTLTVNNLIKNSGYTSISKKFIVWNTKFATIDNNTKREIANFLEAGDATLSTSTSVKTQTIVNEAAEAVTVESLITGTSYATLILYKESTLETQWLPTDTIAAGDSFVFYYEETTRDYLYPIGPSLRQNAAVAVDRMFLTQDKDQTFASASESASGNVVDRLFVKQYFQLEENSNEEITWAGYAALYNKTIATYPARNLNIYKQYYKYLEFYDKSISPVLQSELVDSIHCWVHLTEGTASNKNLKITSDSADGLDSYVAGEFCYEWVDGTIKRITFTVDDHITVQDLYDKGFITSYSAKTETVTRRDGTNYFDKVSTIIVAGPSIKHNDGFVDATETNLTLYSSETIEYAENTDTIGDNTSVSNVTTWEPGNGTNSDTGTGVESVENNDTFVVRFNLTDMTPEGLESVSTDVAYKYQTYSKILTANEGYVLPSSLSVRIGDSTGTVGAESFSYSREHVTSDSYFKSYSTTIGSIVDEIDTTNLSDDTYEFVGLSLDGVNVITDAEREQTLAANEAVVIYKLFLNKKTARLTIFGEKIDGDIEITANAEYITPADPNE